MCVETTVDTRYIGGFCGISRRKVRSSSPRCGTLQHTQHRVLTPFQSCASCQCLTHCIFRCDAGGGANKPELLERRQRAAVERGGEGGTPGVGDLGEAEVEPLEMEQLEVRRGGEGGAPGVGDLGEVEVEPLEVEQLEVRRGDEGLAALLAPRRPAGGLQKLGLLDLEGTQVTDAGCATLAAALDSGALPALKELELDGIDASSVAMEAVYVALARKLMAQTAVLKESKLDDLSASDAAMKSCA